MYMSLKVLSRATLLHLSLNPLFSTATRASTTAIATTSPHLRAFSALYPLCPSYNLYHNHNHNQEHTFSTSASMSAESNPQPPSQSHEHQNQAQAQESEQEQQNQTTPPLALPDVSSSEQATQIDMSGGDTTVKLDALGPLVVNQDGSLSRIGNWAQMTEGEKRNTLRIVGKRNQARLKALREAGVEEEGK